MKSLQLLFALAAVLLLAPVSAVADPFTSEVCPDVSPTDFLDEGFPFDHASNVSECKKLCKVQGKVCAGVAKSIVGCWSRDFKGMLKGEAIDCKDEEGEDLSDCKEDVKFGRQSTRFTLKNFLQEEKQSCSDYVEDCMQACELD